MKYLKIIVILFFTAIFTNGCNYTASKEPLSIYYLNFKPEVANVWRTLAQDYEKETGIKVNVLTVANGNYEQRLKEEIAKREAPTLFHINGPIGYSKWKNYCLDLKDTNLYQWLLDKELAIKTEDGVYGIPYVVEGYGIIYNDAIMKKYFSLSKKAVSISDIKEINSFDKLKELVEDMTIHKEELGIKGVFASTSFSSGEDWRWQTHLANLPIYFEFTDKNISDSDILDFTYANNFKNIFDLYTHYSCTKPKELAKKTVMDSMKEFALEEVAMVQNGNWAWTQISEVAGCKVLEENVHYLPIYMDMPEEENQGLCIGTANYLCVNSMSKEEEQKAAINFMEWVYSSDIGKDYVTNKLNFISPFNTFSEEERPKNPLAQEVINDMSNKNTYSIEWIFPAFPSQKFKDNFGNTLLQYAKEECTWEEVVEFVKTEWASQKAAE